MQARSTVVYLLFALCTVWLQGLLSCVQISGVAFFMVALTGAISVITAFLGALYGTGAVGIYTLVTLSNPNRLQGSQQGRGGYVRYRTE